MKEVTLSRNDGGQRLDKYLTKAFPALPQSLLYKYIRLKRVKVNGKRAAPEQKLAEGDVLQLYINDDLLAAPDADAAWHKASDALEIVYEDDNILLVDKPSGLLCHTGDEGGVFEPTLIDKIKAYLHRKGEWQPRLASSFTPALCNRIDRNTAGIVIAAKTAEALRVMNEKIRAREIDKLYLCLVHGAPKQKRGTLEGFILKDSAKKQVAVLSRPARGALTAVSEYRVLETRGNISLLECRLLTGRTHQIRAQLAAAGHPLVGDTKYGTAARNRRLPFTHQALYSYKVIFSFKGDAGGLSYLKGRAFEAKNAPFLDFFGKLPKK